MSQIFLSFSQMKVLSLLNPKWAQWPLNSKRLKFYSNLNFAKIARFWRGYKDFYEKKWKNHIKWKNSTPVSLFFVKIGMKEVHRNTNKTYFLDFWFFAILGFYGRFWAKMAILAIFRPYVAHICPKKAKNQKSKI